MKGKWIWIDEKKQENSYGEFKESFFWESGKVVLEISADSEYAVFMNGKFVYGGQYADFPWYKIYDKIDLTKYLTVGKNEFRVWVWYCGDKNFCHYVNRPAVRFSIQKEGSVLTESGENTPSRYLPYFKSGSKQKINSLIGYSFELDFNDSQNLFSLSTRIDEMPEQVFLRPLPLLSILEKVKAKRISDRLYDLGRETVGFPFARLRSKGENKVTISFGEHLEDGGVRRIIGDRDFSFSANCVDGEQTLFNPLRKLGCRYFEVSGDVEVLEIGLLPIEYPFTENEFDFGESTKNLIAQTAIRTLRLNALEHYYDCPWREQAFYALDSCLQMRYGYSAFQNTEYPYACLKLMSEDKNSSGLISIVVPTSDRLVIPSFALFYIVAMEEYASVTKDYRLIEEYFEKILQLISVFEKNMENGLVQNFVGADFWNFYEWNSGLDGTQRPYDSALNFTFLLALQSFLKICDILGKKGEKEKYDLLNKELQKEINCHFFDERKGLYRVSNDEERFFELPNAYAILTGTATGKKARTICERFLLDENEMIPCTLSMNAFKYDALLKIDEKKYGNYVLSDIEKKFGDMLKKGATSFWETIKGEADFDGAGSLCHGWSGLPIYYYDKLVENKT
jgi:hypothetical protein